MTDVYFTRTMAQINPILDKIDNDYTKAEIDTLFSENTGGITLLKISLEDYEALTVKDSNTLYIVEDNGKVSLYLGGIKL